MNKLFKRNFQKNIGNLFLLNTLKFYPKIFTRYKNMKLFLLGYFNMNHPVVPKAVAPSGNGLWGIE